MLPPQIICSLDCIFCWYPPWGHSAQGRDAHSLISCWLLGDTTRQHACNPQRLNRARPVRASIECRHRSGGDSGGGLPSEFISLQHLTRCRIPRRPFMKTPHLKLFEPISSLLSADVELDSTTGLVRRRFRAMF